MLNSNLKFMAPVAAVFLLSLAGCSEGGSGGAPPENLLLVTLDTVRADRLGSYGYAAAETPWLDRLAREGVRFEQASAPVPLTLPSHASLLSGLLPPHHGLRNNGAGVFPEGTSTLSTLLSGSGYRTGAFVGAFVLDRRFGLGRGFEVYDDEIPRDPAAGVVLEAERPGREVVDRALAWLGQDTRPFFLWVHLYDAHAPYTPPSPWRERHPGRPYDGEISSVDEQVGRLLQELEKRGLAGRTAVAVVADHGEGLGEHGELTHGLLLYEPTLRVPLDANRNGVQDPTETRRFSEFGNFRLWSGNGEANYDGVHLSARARLSDRFELQGFYTYSEASGNVLAGADEFRLTDAGHQVDLGGARRDVSVDPLNPQCHQCFGPLNTDARHRVTLSGLWRAPWGVNVSGMYRFRSALPCTEFTAADLNGDGFAYDLPGRQGATPAVATPSRSSTCACRRSSPSPTWSPSS